MKELFWNQFDAVEPLGEMDIKAMANELFEQYKDQIESLTTLVMVINHKSWDHYSHANDELCSIYTDLYYDYYEKAIDYLEQNKDEDAISYFVRTLD